MRVYPIVMSLVLMYLSKGVEMAKENNKNVENGEKNADVKRVAGLIIFRRVDDTIQYLMLRPKNDKKEWSLPKGRLKSGEDPLTTAIRETGEETGYVTDDLNIYENQRFEMNQLTKKKGKDKTVYFWLAELTNEKKQPKLSNEHRTCSWVTKEQALEICKLPEFAKIVNHFDEVAKSL